MRTELTMSRLATTCSRWAAVVRTIIGAPDYDRYLTHHLSHHPERPPLTREEFMRQRLEDRYSRPGSRCC